MKHVISSYRVIKNGDEKHALTEMTLNWSFDYTGGQM